MVDITSDACIVLYAIASTGQRFGAGHIIDVIRGSEKKRVLELRHNELEIYGKGKHIVNDHLRTIIDNLFNQDLIVRTDDEYSVLKLTPQSRAVLAGEKQVMVRARKENPQQTKKQKLVHAEEDELLFIKLKTLRRNLADERGVPPFVIFADRSLHEMAIRRPITREKMFDVHGIGEVKMKSYGDIFLKEIREHLGKNAENSEDDAWQPENVQPKKPKNEKSETVNETWDYIRQGYTIEQIAEKRSLSQTTIADHIERCITMGRDVPIGQLVPQKIIDHLNELIPTIESGRLKEIKEAAMDEVTYEQIKLIKALLVNKNQ
jgi:ATP-dependent DNA helicase RecQ